MSRKSLPSNDDADVALKEVYTAAQVLIEHSEVSGTVFVGCITIDRGRGDLGSGDFFIGDPDKMSDALARLIAQRPELSAVFERAWLKSRAITAPVAPQVPSEIYLDNIAPDNNLLTLKNKKDVSKSK